MSSNAHKPSEKHTLDEVLKSLQDLMRGELLQEAPKPPPPPKPHYGKVGRPRKAPKAPADPVAAIPPSASEPVDVDAVLASLRSLVNRELAPEEGAKPDGEPTSVLAPTAPIVEIDEDSPPPPMDALEAAGALADADAALSELDDTDVALIAGSYSDEAGPEDNTQSSVVLAEPPDGETGSATEIQSFSTDEPAPVELPLPEVTIPPEGKQQEFSFGEAQMAAQNADDLSLEFSPSDETKTQPIAEAEPRGDAPALPPDRDLTVIADAESVPAGDASKTETADSTIAEPEEIVLEAGPPTDEALPEIDESLSGAPGDTASSVESTVPPRNTETSAESDVPDNLVEFEPPVLAEHSPTEPEGDTGAGKQAIKGTSEDLEGPPPEIEVAEAPGIPADLESVELSGSATPTGEPDLGTLGGHLEVDFSDLPILQDVVVPPPATAQLNLIEPPLPAADRARQLAVRVAARLNIERRKRGEPGIDTKTIHRLQQLLREELEKAGAKGENTPKS